MLDRHAEAGLPLRAALLLISLAALSARADDDRPPAGRSLFDRLYLREKGYEIPFPFSKLVTELDQQLDKSLRPLVGVKGALLPLGRSLQRKAGYPEVFRYPRVVIAVDGELKREAPPFPHDTRDKLYIGFNEKARVLEIISYNEDAGRFEFQVAHDYEEGKRPKVVYARRRACLACHQNEAPIFSDAPWDETQANPKISEKLKEILGSHYQGIATSSTQDEPYDFDLSKGRANMLSVYQNAWKKLCGTMQCRQALFREALRMRIDGASEIDEKAVSKNGFAKEWKKAYGKELKIPNGTVLNRDPLFQKESLENLVEVESEFEPLNLRAPLETWEYSPENAGRLFAGVARMFTDAEIKDIKKQLGDMKLEDAVKKIDGYEAFKTKGPFPKRNLLAALYRANGWSYGVWREKYPPLEVDTDEAVLKSIKRSSELGTFRRCASCHNNAIGVPPNFLHGELKDVRSQLAQCAERIAYRISMWEKPPGKRGKSPMPPESALEISHEEFAASGELRVIREYVERELKKKGTSMAKVLEKDFSALPACAGSH